MRTPEEEMAKHAMNEWREAVQSKEKADWKFLQEAITAMLDGMLSLESKINSMAAQEWKGARQLMMAEDEAKNQHYRILRLELQIKNLLDSKNT